MAAFGRPFSWRCCSKIIERIQGERENRLLPETLWTTFDAFEQAEAYGKRLEGLLAQGIVPASLLERTTGRAHFWR
jgi:hypothetical protein